MQRSLATGFAVVLGVSAFGLTGCVPAPKPLACSAAVSSPFPAHNAAEVVTVHSTAGATVLTVAGYKTGATARVTTTNAMGVGKTVYSVGAAAYDLRVPVIVLVAKGGHAGLCATSFTPRVPAPTGPVVKSVAVGTVTITAKTLSFGLTVSCPAGSTSARVHILAKEAANPVGSAAPTGSSDTTFPCSTTGSDQAITITSTGGVWYETNLLLKIDTVATSPGKIGPTTTFYRSIPL